MAKVESVKPRLAVWLYTVYFLTGGDLRRNVKATRARAFSTLDLLAADGLLEASEDDGGARTVKLTKEGREVVEGMLGENFDPPSLHSAGLVDLADRLEAEAEAEAKAAEEKAAKKKAEAEAKAAAEAAEAEAEAKTKAKTNGKGNQKAREAARKASKKSPKASPSAKSKTSSETAKAVA